jgi:uncharacterized protein with PIN domain
MKFVVDCMLGKLGKWLRILGFDALYLNKAEDKDLLFLARREKRILLTKDHELLRSAAGQPSLFIGSDSWPEQLVQVLDVFKLRAKARPHSRCLACNVALRRVPKRSVRNLVPPFVFARASSFAACPSCGRLFWPGTHFRDMDRTIDRILGERRGRKKEPAEDGKKPRTAERGQSVGRKSRIIKRDPENQEGT